MVVPYSLTSARAQEARSRFYACRHRSTTSKCKLSFEEFYTLLCDKDVDFRQISAEAGINESSVIALYVNHFMGLFGNQTPHERRRESLRRAQHKRLTEVCACIRNDPSLKLIEREAKNLGHTVRHYVGRDSQGRPSLHIWRLVISGVDCHVQPITRPGQRRPGSRQRISRMFLRREQVQAVQMVLIPIRIRGFIECVLVIPSEKLLSAIFKDESENAALYVPYQLVPNSCVGVSRARLDVWSYKNRWDLVVAQTQMAA